jgi:protein gp37
VRWNRASAEGQFGEVRRAGKLIARGDIRDLRKKGLAQTGDIFEKARPRVFCSSLADWLDDEVSAEWLADLLFLVYSCPALDWQLLTKRPGLFRPRIESVWATLRATEENWAFRGWIARWFDGVPPENVWVGTTVEDQARAKERIPLLVEIPARVRFLSCEPLIGPVDLRLLEPLFGSKLPGGFAHPKTSIHWIICGGESGPEARPMHPKWARSLRDQCAAAGIPFLFKQWGEWAPVSNPQPRDFRNLCMFEGADPKPAHLETEKRCDDWIDNRSESDLWMKDVGKIVAGNRLDGREWHEFPKVSVQ